MLHRVLSVSSDPVRLVRACKSRFTLPHRKAGSDTQFTWMKFEHKKNEDLDANLVGVSRNVGGVTP
ncbi:hypothetical protein PISMIDRAFT_680434 [Pisolithus microcarpus 441]|uniref:Uncharacterized protein n=1 Tax=Pisolithus microcarpus 441 TaxID=765257 RepID=A0A0C9Z8Q6_9AGAM|nr:hypothetical protein PISMIDRAFT_680434 [Pisolithus microcarpus 441]